MTFVDVNSIEIQATVWDEVSGKSIALLKGTKYQFHALPTPSSASWPSGSPVWSGVTTVSVGQKIDLGFKVEPSNLTTTDIQWIVPGTIVKNYTPGFPR